VSELIGNPAEEPGEGAGLAHEAEGTLLGTEGGLADDVVLDILEEVDAELEGAAVAQLGKHLGELRGNHKAIVLHGDVPFYSFS